MTSGVKPQKDGASYGGPIVVTVQSTVLWSGEQHGQCRAKPRAESTFRVDGGVAQGHWGGSEHREARAQISSHQTRTSMNGEVGEINCGAHHAAVTERPILVLAMLSPPYLCDPCTCGVLT